MYKDLKAYYSSTHKAAADATPKEAAVLLTYHIERVRDFQHERMVHLLVTLFFGLLTVAGAAALFVSGEGGITLVTILLNCAVGLLLITELAYVWHYYHLENGVQRLYKITDLLRNKIEDEK